MASLIVPRLDEEPWPTLGPQVAAFIEERAVFGPGPLKGEPAVLSPEKRAIIYRAYEVYPRGHELAGRRRFKRVVWSVRKGLAKTELLSWVAYVELHPEAEIRFDGWDASGNPVGRPVASPYIPLLSYAKKQTEELAYGCLLTVVTEGPDAYLFDAGVDRIQRLDALGREDGKAVAISGSPNARDGARTTFQGFDEPHRCYTPRLHAAHRTMLANLPKRPDADAWNLYVGTAGELGQDSIAERLYHEAEDIAAGKIKNPRIFVFHRDAGKCHRGAEKNATGHNLGTQTGRLAAIKEATGPDGEYGPGQFADIAEQWDHPKADLSYLERVWCNLWRRADLQAFDPLRVRDLTTAAGIPPKSVVTAGFDGARRLDSTAIVVTDVLSGAQALWGLWERPADADEWEITEAEVTASVEQLMSTYRVWRFNGDPPHWTDTLGTWAGRWGCVEEWWTNRPRAMAWAVRAYNEAQESGSVTYVNEDRLLSNSVVPDETTTAALARHLAAAGRQYINLHDDSGRRLFVLEKMHETRKMDAAVAAVLSWQARLDALRSGKFARRTSSRVRRLY